MILLITYILNIIDYLFTLYWVRKYGIEIESNPFGRWLFDNNIAWVVKIFAVGGLLALLGYLIHRQPKAAAVAYIPLAVFAAVDVYHISLAVIYSR
jgi:hypothetical protein